MTALRGDIAVLTERLRAATRSLHTQAERAGVMRALLARALGRSDYCAMLANLHAIYSMLERRLTADAAHPLIGPIADPLLLRSAALESDLLTLHGPGWAHALPIAAAARTYVQRLADIGAGEMPRLIAHAYVRYLGDLNGGQLLQPIVRSVLNLQGAEGTRFYQFDVPDASAHARHYRGVFDALALEPAAADAVIAEACWSFEQHIALFEELAAHTRSETWGS